jgi:hypothetical protein
MDELLQHPAFQAGIAPLLIGLVVAAALWRTRWPWLGVVAAYVTAVGLSIGLGLQPLSAGRKVTLLIGLAALLGAAFDQINRPWRWTVPVLSVACGVATWWVFASVLGQRGWNERALLALGLFAFVAGHAALVLRLRADGASTGAVGVAGGVGIGVAALLSASIGYFVGGVAMAAGAGALMLLQFLLNQTRPAGLTGSLPLALGLALFGTASVLLAQLPWFVLPLLALVPLAACFNPLRVAGLRARLFTAAALATVAAALFVAAVWIAVRAASLPTG